jgi:serine/threonine protein phosphatase PrpC
VISMRTLTDGLVFTHRGRRKRNEDSGTILRLAEHHLVAIVCDGMGGHLAGDYASSTVVSSLERAVAAGADPAQALESINARLYGEAAADPTKAGMGTTVVVAVLDNDMYTVYNVGDSRAYLFEASGAIRQISRDHSYVAEAIAAGELTPDAAASSSYRNALTRAIGTDPTVRVDVFGPSPLPPGGAIILCTDGVYKVLSDERIAELLRDNLGENLPSVAISAFNAGSDDNTTIAALWISRSESRSAARREKSISAAQGVLDKLAGKFDQERERNREKVSGTLPPTRQRRRAMGAVLSALGLALIGIAAADLYRKEPASASRQIPAARSGGSRQAESRSLQDERVRPELAEPTSERLSDAAGRDSASDESKRRLPIASPGSPLEESVEREKKPTVGSPPNRPEEVPADSTVSKNGPPPARQPIESARSGTPSSSGKACQDLLCTQSGPKPLLTPATPTKPKKGQQ